MSDDRPAVMITDPSKQVRHFLVNYAHGNWNPPIDSTDSTDTPEEAEREPQPGNNESRG